MLSQKIAIIGSGNWGTAIAKVIGENAAIHREFNSTVHLWIHQTSINGMGLTEIINNNHVNPKYLPGIQLPENVVADSRLKVLASNADILVFVLPHQFLSSVLQQMKAHIKPSTKVISLIKGLHMEGERMVLASEMIEAELKTPVAVLSGANVALEVAKEEFCETTIGCRQHQQLYQKMFSRDYFRVKICSDVKTVELCGGLKNIVALGAGFSDGLKKGGNTKAAIIRIGLQEMIRFCQRFLPETCLETFYESCGVADLITTCYGGRNRRVAEAFITTGKSFQELETELLKGQKLQGTLACQAIIKLLQQEDLLDDFPMFYKIYQVAFQGADAETIFKCAVFAHHK